MNGPLIKVENKPGEPIKARGFTITPFSQVFRLRWPFIKGGIVWNRPFSVLVQSEEGEERVMTVPDVTRLTQIALFGSSFIFLLFGLQRLRRRT